MMFCIDHSPPQFIRLATEAIVRVPFALGIMTAAQFSELIKNPGTVMMDTTFGVNRYGFELGTLSLINEFANGFPFAHAILQSTTAEELAKFLSAVKTKVSPKLPTAWQPAFIIDMSFAEVNAIKAVFGNEYASRWIIYCTWHVTRAWVKGAWEKMPNSSDRFDRSTCLSELLDVLYTVTRTGEAPVDPLSLFSQWVLKWEPKFQAFVKYVDTNYRPTIHRWAHGFMDFAHADQYTNNLLERWHRTLKEYCHWKSNCRLDWLLAQLLSLADDLWTAVICQRQGARGNAKHAKKLEVCD